MRISRIPKVLLCKRPVRPIESVEYLDQVPAVKLVAAAPIKITLSPGFQWPESRFRLHLPHSPACCVNSCVSKPLPAISQVESHHFSLTSLSRTDALPRAEGQCLLVICRKLRRVAKVRLRT